MNSPWCMDMNPLQRFSHLIKVYLWLPLWQEKEGKALNIYTYIYIYLTIKCHLHVEAWDIVQDKYALICLELQRPGSTGLGFLAGSIVPKCRITKKRRKRRSVKPCKWFICSQFLCTFENLINSLERTKQRTF